MICQSRWLKTLVMLLKTRLARCISWLIGGWLVVLILHIFNIEGDRSGEVDQWIALIIRFPHSFMPHFRTFFLCKKIDTHLIKYCMYYSSHVIDLVFLRTNQKNREPKRKTTFLYILFLYKFHLLHFSDIRVSMT